MEIERYTNDQGQFRCFVVDNTKVSRIGMTKMISKLDGVVVTKKPKFYDDDVFCEFLYKDHQFCIDEPYGDNITYDVVAPKSGLKEFEEIATHFEKTNPINKVDWGVNMFFMLRMCVASVILFGAIKWLSS